MRNFSINGDLRPNRNKGDRLYVMGNGCGIAFISKLNSPFRREPHRGRTPSERRLGQDSSLRIQLAHTVAKRSEADAEQIGRLLLFTVGALQGLFQIRLFNFLENVV